MIDKQKIKEAMNKISKRKQGTSKLVYDKNRQMIVAVDRLGNVKDILSIGKLREE